ncbi:MAG: GFA family protein [Stenotrophobium sp.]
MSLKTYTCSCHCGAVRYDAEIDLAQGTIKCNCSICTKARAWLVFTSGQNVRLAPGAEAATTEYQWTPPGKPHPFIHYHFCKTCGVRVFGRADHPKFGGLFYAVPVNVIDGLDADELAATPINYVDGRNDLFEQRPADIRNL